MSTVLGGYRLIASLGRGGMAEVYLAVRSGISGFHKLTVIKRLRADLEASSSAARFRALLLDEARLAARLRHPNIVQTLEVGEDRGQPFMTMEYLEGQSLGRVMKSARRADARLPTAYALRVIADVLAALDYAHTLADYDGTPLGIVHRDVSPQNVFWTYAGEIKLVDFGVAKFAQSSTQTDAGTVKGKLTYMAPEQARGESIDGRADLFAVGIMLWELVSGRRLLRAQTDAATLQRLLFGELPSLARVVPGIDPELARISARALERDRERRYQSAKEMRDDLERVLASGPRRDELAAFVAPLFAEERAVVAQHIRDALAGGEAIVSLEMADLGSSKGVEIAHTAETVADPVLPIDSPTTVAPVPNAPPPPRRSRVVWLVAAVAAVLGVDAVVWWQLRPGAPAAAVAEPPAPAPAVPTPAAAPHAADLRLCGSNTVGAELAPAIVDAFLARKGAAKVSREVEPEHARLTATLGGREVVVDIRAAGTATGFEGLVAGSCDVAMASRAINDTEVGKLSAMGHGDLRSPATEHVIALDGIAVIVHPNNKLASLDRGQLHDVFTGKLNDWSQLGGAAGPITVVARDAKSGTFDTFKSLVMGGDEVPATIRRFAQSDALADTVAGDPSAIGFIGLAYVRSAKALGVADRGAPPMLPTAFTVATEAYMLSRRLYLYTTPTPKSPLVTELVSFALSQHGQRVVRDAGFVDLSVALRDPQPCDARCPPRYAAVVAGARRISLDFRFRGGIATRSTAARRATSIASSSSCAPIPRRSSCCSDSPTASAMRRRTRGCRGIARRRSSASSACAACTPPSSKVSAPRCRSPRTRARRVASATAASRSG
jgi:phosphate binding protein